MYVSGEYKNDRGARRRDRGRCGAVAVSVKHAFLGLLAEGPLHGYELKLSFEERLLPSSPLNYGQVYGSLERLERDGLVEH